MAFWNDPSALTPKQSHRWVISFGTANSPAYQGTRKNNFLPYYFAKSVDIPSYELAIQQAKYLYSHTFNFPKRLVWKPITITFYDVIMEQSLDEHYKMIFSPILKDNKIQDKEVSVASGDLDGSFIKQSTQLFFYRLFQDAGYINPNEYNPDDQLLRFRSYTFKKNMVASFIDKRANSSNLIQDIFAEQSTQITRNITANAEKITSQNYSEQTTLNIHQLAPYEDGQTSNQETWKLYNPIISDVKVDRMDYSSENILSISVTVHYDWAALQPNIVTSNYATDIATTSVVSVEQQNKLLNEQFKQMQIDLKQIEIDQLQEKVNIRQEKQKAETKPIPTEFVGPPAPRATRAISPERATVINATGDAIANIGKETV